MTYEELCLNPLSQFRDLFEFAEVPWTSTDKERIEHHSKLAHDRSDNPYSTHRKSAKMIDQWREEISEPDLVSLNRAYVSLNPPIFNTDW